MYWAEPFPPQVSFDLACVLGLTCSLVVLLASTAVSAYLTEHARQRPSVIQLEGLQARARVVP